MIKIHRPRRTVTLLAAAVVGGATLLGSAQPALGAPDSTGRAGSAEPAAARKLSSADGPGLCPPRAAAIDFSDALDKLSVDGATVGGLSDLSYDRPLHSYVSSVDNNGTDPSRLWFFRDLARPKVWRAPLVLKQADGTPYTGATADNEGLAVLPDGRFVVSSEIEPSIRIFNRNGIQRGSLPVPPRFAVAPAGEATRNATLEGLGLSPDAHTLVAGMEGTLSGDLPAGGGEGLYRRFLVYHRADRSAADAFRPAGQWGYRVDPGMRISEVQVYAPDRVLVMEAAFSAATGNTIKLYAARTRGATDVSGIANLSAEPGAVLHKTLIADVTACPTLGATAKQPQTNPLLDNYEGMSTRRLGGDVYAVTLISDDNFNPSQITRVLNLVAVLP